MATVFILIIQRNIKAIIGMLYPNFGLLSLGIQLNKVSLLFKSEF